MTTGRLVLVFLTGVSCCLHALLASILALFHLFIVHLMLPFSHSFLPPPPLQHSRNSQRSLVWN